MKTPGPCIPYPKTLKTLDGFQQEGWERRRRRFGAFCDSGTHKQKSGGIGLESDFLWSCPKPEFEEEDDDDDDLEHFVIQEHRNKSLVELG